MDAAYFLRRSKGLAKDIDPRQIALQLESDESWTFDAFDNISNQYADIFSSLGVMKGDRIGILMYNCLEYWAAYFAAAKIGAIAVRLNFRLVPEELEYALNDSGAKVLCFHSSFLERLEQVRDKVPVSQWLCLQDDDSEMPVWVKPWAVLGEGSSSFVSETQIDGSDSMMLMYTSGTTGRPKGALWTHDNTLWFAAMQAIKWQMTNKCVSMTTGPLYHVGALEDLLLPTLLVGGRSIVTKSGSFDIRRILKVMEQEKVTHVLLFPYMLYDMLSQPDLEQYDLSSLQAIISGGDPVLPWAIEKLNEVLPNVGLIQIYGLTEGTPIGTCLNPEDPKEKGHTVGKPLPFAEVKVAGEDGIPVGVGEVEEIWIKSPSVSSEYWNRPEATAETFVDGWCRTGDLGRVDEDGFLAIAGRKKDMIRSGGENIYPSELEDVINRHPKVKNVAIIGLPHPTFLETVCAVIVPKDDVEVTEEDIVDYCKQHMAGFKKPRHVVFVDELPRTPSGKVKKFQLRNKYQSLA
ncbi:acyl--CoA ligase [Metallumcola ferriviriculae]|uniref:Acyl--CoA ligase n=1 Tax=Metallumcola ferriviriculae TaxID=3039180 RepID=A0AAU0UMM5_9FIRM|nr:acyl--CoA ligase [Desulfitibacteraceae bacterium MK1]